MKKLLYKSSFASVYLNTELAACSYGLPVLDWKGQAYGPADVLPSGVTAGNLVRMFVDEADPGGDLRQQGAGQDYRAGGGLGCLHLPQQAD